MKAHEWLVKEGDRLNEKGPGALSDTELLTLIIRNRDAASELLNRYSLSELTHATTEELTQIPGIWRSRAQQIQALIELARRLSSNGVSLGSIRIATASDVFSLMHPRMKDLIQEQFDLLILNVKNFVKRIVTISIGSLDIAIVHPREVFCPAIRHQASSVICCHNHGSGDPNPSTEDKELTTRLVKTGEIVGIKVLDHVIISPGSYFSFSDHGLIGQSLSR